MTELIPSRQSYVTLVTRGEGLKANRVAGQRGRYAHSGGSIAIRTIGTRRNHLSNARGGASRSDSRRKNADEPQHRTEPFEFEFIGFCLILA